jgi:hypothetical protein
MEYIAALFEFVTKHPEYAIIFVIYQNWKLQKVVDLNVRGVLDIKKELLAVDRRVIALEIKGEVHHAT